MRIIKPAEDVWDASSVYDSGQENTQDAINAALAQQIGTKYEKPEGGIPKTDLAQSVQDSLDSADEVPDLKSATTEIEDFLHFEEDTVVPIYKSLADNASRSVNHDALPLIVTKMNYDNAPYTVTGIRMNITSPGTLSVGKILKANVSSGETFDNNYLSDVQTLNIVSTGVQVIEITPIEITNEYYLIFGLPTDTFSSVYGGSGTGLDTAGFIAVIKGKYTGGIAYVGIDVLTTVSGIPSDIRAVIDSVYKGKKLSILGDSISTYDGFIPEGNSTWYPRGNVTNVAYTWWYKLCAALGMTIDTNNSWSGSRVTTTNGDASAGCMSRCQNLGSPDVIIVWMGINDFNTEVALGTYDGTTELPSITTSFREAYAIMLDKILTAYPTAEIWVCTLPPCEYNGTTGFPEINGNSIALSQFNKAIRELADAFGVKVLEHGKCGLTYQNLSIYTISSDDVHPNKYGHSLVANNDIWQMDGAVGKRYPIS